MTKSEALADLEALIGALEIECVDPEDGDELCIFADADRADVTIGMIRKAREALIVVAS